MPGSILCLTLLVTTRIATAQPDTLSLVDTTFVAISLDDPIQDMFPFDVDRDGDMDMVCLIGSSIWSWIQYENWWGAAGVWVPDEPASSIVKAELHDLNGDAIPELIFQNWANEIHVCQGAPGVIQFSSTYLSLNAWSVSSARFDVGDLDGDGDLDLVFPSGPSELTISWNDGDGVFSSQLAVPVGMTMSISSLAIADIDDDQDHDLLLYLADPDSGIYCSLSNMSGDGSQWTTDTLAHYPSSLGPALEFPEMQISDVDGDGDQDILVNNYHASFWIERTPGPGLLPIHMIWNIHTMDPDAPTDARTFGLADCDDDIDLVRFPAVPLPGLFVPGNGSGFGDRMDLLGVPGPFEETARVIRLVDMDGDGWNDAAALVYHPMEDSYDLRWYRLNNSFNSFPELTYAPDTWCPTSGSFQAEAEPSNGTWSGAAEPDGIIDPELLGPGPHTSAYELTYPDGCIAHATWVLELLDPIVGVLMLPIDTVALNATPFPLTGGSPPGGIFQSPGVVQGVFAPVNVGAGWHEIRYFPPGTFPGFTCVLPGVDSIYVDDLAVVDCLGVTNGSALPGSPCNDGDPGTGSDTWSSDCACIGLLIDCMDMPGGDQLPGTPCDDGILATSNDQYTADCECLGQDCAGELGGGALPGTPCDDGMNWTYNDTWTSSCTCVGEGMNAINEAIGPPGLWVAPNPVHGDRTFIHLPTGCPSPRELNLWDARGQLLSNTFQWSVQEGLIEFVPGSVVGLHVLSITCEERIHRTRLLILL